jgi:hypothetical protein
MRGSALWFMHTTPNASRVTPFARRTPETPAAAREGAFARLAPYRHGAIFTGKSPGEDVRGDPLAHCPAAGAARASMTGLRGSKGADDDRRGAPRSRQTAQFRRSEADNSRLSLSGPFVMGEPRCARGAKRRRSPLSPPESGNVGRSGRCRLADGSRPAGRQIRLVLRDGHKWRPLWTSTPKSY